MQKVYTTHIRRLEQMARFLDTHKIGSFTEEELLDSQKSPANTIDSILHVEDTR